MARRSIPDDRGRVSQPPSHRQTRLGSGIRVVSERLDWVRSVAIGIWIGVGSRDERNGQAGMTHFLEHLLFKGTRSYTAQEIAETFDGIGAELNAATTREYTVVFARVLDEHLELALDVMTDMVFAPTLSDLDAEREVVLEEIAMVEDTPQDAVHDLLSAAIFPQHPLGRPVIGNAEVIASASRAALARFHRSRYTGDNLVVAAAGSVDHDRLVRLTRRMSAAKGAGEPAGRDGRPARSPRPRPGATFQRKRTEQVHVCVGAAGLSRRDPRRFAGAVLDSLLGGSASSRLFQEIREKRGLAYSVYTFSAQYADTGEVGVYVGTREDNLATCLEIVAREFGAVAAGAFDERELQRARDNLKGRVMLALESTPSRMNRLGRALVTGAELLEPDDVLARIDGVDGHDVAALARELLGPERLSVAAIGPSARSFRTAVGRIHPGLTG
jgi:predicted Zn-dependent peptidase